MAHMGQSCPIRIRGSNVKRVLQFGAGVRSAESSALYRRRIGSSILYFGRQSARSNNSEWSRLYLNRVHLQALPPMAELWHSLGILPFLSRVDNVWNGVCQAQQWRRRSHNI